MAATCGTLIKVCRARVTRLTSTGAVAPAPNNHVVTGSIVEATITPEILEGERRTLINGCDCPQVTYRGKDKLIAFGLSITFSAMIPALIEILTGAAIFTNAGGDPIGNSFNNQLSCDVAQQPDVAVELWQEMWVTDHPDTVYPYARWVFPSSSWQVGEGTLNVEFFTPPYNGFTRSNPLWLNPYLDLPTGITAAAGAQGTGGWFYDDGPLPTPVCGYSTFST